MLHPPHKCYIRHVTSVHVALLVVITYMDDESGEGEGTGAGGGAGMETRAQSGV